MGGLGFTGLQFSWLTGFRLYFNSLSLVCECLCLPFAFLNESYHQFVDTATLFLVNKGHFQLTHIRAHSGRKALPSLAVRLFSQWGGLTYSPRLAKLILVNKPSEQLVPYLQRFLDFFQVLVAVVMLHYR